MRVSEDLRCVADSRHVDDLVADLDASVAFAGNSPGAQQQKGVEEGQGQVVGYRVSEALH